MTLLFLGIGSILVVLLIIFVIVGIKIENDKGEKDVIRNVYTYLVLFATLMMTIGGSVGAFMAVADIINPAPYHQNFEEFKRFGEAKPNTGSEEANEEANLSEEKLQEQYEAMVAREKERQVARAKNSLIKSFGWIVIPLPVFIYFQRRLVNQKTE